MGDKNIVDHESKTKSHTMPHSVDKTQPVENLNNIQDDDASKIGNTAPRSTFRRYWHTNADHINPYKKVNTPKGTNSSTINNPNINLILDNENKPKEEKRDVSANLPADLLTLMQPMSSDCKKTIEIIENDEDKDIVVLHSSDEDEVIEVAMPPKPTITIDSSDEEVSQNFEKNNLSKVSNTSQKVDREISASPVPSIVSSVSDEFIRGDCIALNISSKRPENHSFDFSLHGNDLVSQTPPSKKRKKKRNKDNATTTPISSKTSDKSSNNSEVCFVTPQSKVKSNKQKPKSYAVSSVPNADVYDSDSNHSLKEIDKIPSNIVTKTTLPNTDVYESDSSQSTPSKETNKSVATKENETDGCDTTVSTEKSSESSINLSKSTLLRKSITIIDLTNTSENTIEENIVMGNVSGFKECDDYDKNPRGQDNEQVNKFGSTRVPSILYEDLDFDNLKGNRVVRRRRYSLTTLRAEMEKFYNESWGGENFNHKEIQKYMSRDKNLWLIDPKDKLPTPAKKKVVCHYCNRPGHRDDPCRMRPPVCYMCGATGHYETRCPRKICVNCGSPSYLYTSICHNCSSWNKICCNECGQHGHPSSHCPDLWRRYHNTIDDNVTLKKNQETKQPCQQYCSGCARRGHLVHTCRALILSNFPMNNPYVFRYIPVHPKSGNERDLHNVNVRQSMNTNNKRNVKNFLNQSYPLDSTVSSVAPKSYRNKRQSESPTVHRDHVNKKRFLSETDESNFSKNVVASNHKRRSQSISDENKKPMQATNKFNNSFCIDDSPEETTNCIPITSGNCNEKGQIIQDNEVSDTSDVVTSSRIYITDAIKDKLKTSEGNEWLKLVMGKYDVIVESSDDVDSYLTVKGKIGNQESFQTELRDWTNLKTVTEDPKKKVDELQGNDENYLVHNVPKKKGPAMKFIGKALESLNQYIGNPYELYKNLGCLQTYRENLIKEKVVKPAVLNHLRHNINYLVKKLNMILLGQTGLANGDKHLSELHTLHERLKNDTRLDMSPELRTEIGEHYHCIFSATPRDDYVDLLDEYYGSNYISSKNAKKKKPKQNPKGLKKTTDKSTGLTPEHNVQKISNNFNDHPVNNISRAQAHLKNVNLKILQSLHKRLMKAHPTDVVQKKAQVILTRKLQSKIFSLNVNTNPGSKLSKKVRQVKKQAELFLSSII